MNPEIFAKWLSRQGYSVIKTQSSFWYEAGSRAYQAFPYHWLIKPTENELDDVFKKHRGVALRYSTDLESSIGCISYHVILDKSEYTIDDLDRRTRQNIRKGLKNCSVEKISIERFAKESWLLQKDTMERQGSHVTIDEEKWLQRYFAAADLPGFEAWGAISDGRLVASLLVFHMEDCCEFITQQCHRDYLNARANNALVYTATEDIINRGKIRYIFYTLQSLDAPPSVDEFKFRMGFTARPVRQTVMFHPLMRVFANKVSQKTVKWLVRLNPKRRDFAKLEGMLRFNVQGSKPLTEQKWPECTKQ